MSNNWVVNKIKEITSWIKSNPQVVEPNMQEFMECLVDISVLDDKNKKEAMTAYADMYALRFGNPRCPDRTDTAMWKLFTTVFTEVSKKSYMIQEHTEAVLLCMIMGVGNYCLQQKRAGWKYDNHNEFAKLSDYKEKYLSSENPKFELLVEAAFQEIQDCYKK